MSDPTEERGLARERDRAVLRSSSVDVGFFERGGRRWRSLDVLRGGTVALMILVNNMGDGAHVVPALAHAKWNSWTLADLVFPMFLFVMGASMNLGRTKISVTRAVRRGLILVMLGLALHAFPHVDLAELRYPGVLQRLGVTYILAAIVLRALERRGRVAVCFLVLVVYAALLRWVPFGGHRGGVLTPSANLPGWIDQRVFGWRHVYANGGYDPEGLLATFPATVNVIAGALAIDWLRTARGPISRTCRRLAGGGFALIGLGLLTTIATPINKRMWTSSFTLLSCGFSTLALVGVVWGLDGRSVEPNRRETGRSSGVTHVFAAMGRNALVAFLGSEELHYFLTTFHPRRDGPTLRRSGYLELRRVLPPTAASTVYGVVVVVVFALLALLMDRRKLYVRL